MCQQLSNAQPYLQGVQPDLAQFHDHSRAAWCAVSSLHNLYKSNTVQVQLAVSMLDNAVSPLGDSITNPITEITD